MFQIIRDLSEAILGLAKECSEASSRNGGALLRHDELAARVAALESTLSVRLAEAEALLISAESHKRIARNAENRTHTLERKRAEREEDALGYDEDGSDAIEARDGEFQDLDAAANGVDVSTLHEGMEVPRRLTRREQALNRVKRMHG